MENKIHITALVHFTGEVNHKEQILWLNENNKLLVTHDAKPSTLKPVILLVLSDEEIKALDLIYSSETNTIYNSVHNIGKSNHCKKVIASTSKELTPNSYIESIPDWWVNDFNRLRSCPGVEISRNSVLRFNLNGTIIHGHLLGIRKGGYYEIKISYHSEKESEVRQKIEIHKTLLASEDPHLIYNDNITILQPKEKEVESLEVSDREKDIQKLANGVLGRIYPSIITRMAQIGEPAHFALKNIITKILIYQT